MDSPILRTLFENILLSKSGKKPVYLQLSESILLLIKEGKLQSGQKIPSSRIIASWININRITVSKALDELKLQGWIERSVGKGSFVSTHISNAGPVPLNSLFMEEHSGFHIESKPYLEDSYVNQKAGVYLDDGLPDSSLAPLKELYRAYRNQLTWESVYHKYGRYGLPDGSDSYRDAISSYMNETRGLHTTAENILSVRGTVMGLNLVCNALIGPGDIVISGIPGWNKAEMNFIHAKARHIGVRVDEHGIVVDEIREICKKQKIRMVYVTPHHHYPTTVSLRIDRRLELLKLANEYGFIIFEDDYDFEFHYAQRPLLPLASADENGMVIYCGSFSKSFSPAFRIGYLVGSPKVIQHLSKVRVLMDRQGDQILESAMAELIREGTNQRYLKKALKVYFERRNFFCDLLKTKLGESVQFTVPEGGMSVWVTFDSKLEVHELSEKALQKGLAISDGRYHKYDQYKTNAIRLGFASSPQDKLEQGITILKSVM